MNKRGKSWHLIVTALLIVVFSFTALFGVSYTYGDTKNVYIKGAEDIRFGIDIRGGVDVTFMPADGVEATDDQMTAAKTVIEDRLVGLGITDYEDYVDYNKDRIIVRFPWKTGETDFNPQTAIDEIGTTAKMVFRKGSTADGEEILSGDDVTSATAGYNQENGYVVQLQFSADGAKKGLLRPPPSWQPVQRHHLHLAGRREHLHRYRQDCHHGRQRCDRRFFHPGPGHRAGKPD